MRRKLILVFGLIAVLAMVVAPAFAQSYSRTISKTEDAINQTYRATNPYYRSITDVHVDLQPGQAVISAIYTRRAHDPIAVTTTLVPYIENGRLFWQATSATANGQPVSDALLAQINASIETSWRNYWRRNAPAGHITDVQISETSISVSVSW